MLDFASGGSLASKPGDRNCQQSNASPTATDNTIQRGNPTSISRNKSMMVDAIIGLKLESARPKYHRLVRRIDDVEEEFDIEK